MISKYHDFGDWRDILGPVIESELMEWTLRQVENEYGSGVKVCPGVYSDIFKAFTWTHAKDFKCLILGQDPYPNRVHATGIAFAVPNSIISIPPSLRNLYDEIERCTGRLMVNPDTSLGCWAKQGVLLLNSALTVQEGKPGSHKKYWDSLMSSMIDHIANAFPGHPLIAFGKEAEALITPFANEKMYVLRSPHPAAAVYGRSKGAIGSDVFAHANMILANPDYGVNKEEIDWTDNLPF